MNGSALKSKLQTFLFGGSAAADSYSLTRIWIIRGLGFIYCVAFSIIYFQGPALWGDSGILPIAKFTDLVKRSLPGSDLDLFFKLPSLFYFLPPDRWIAIFGLFGILGGLILLAGYANFILLLILWLLQLSFVNSGQIFFGYGWETQLLEFTFLCFFIVPFFHANLKKAKHPPPRIIIWAMRWMLFRLMFGAGMIKIRGDSCWRDLTCLIYHYETQPNPHPLSYFYNLMPPAFQYMGVLFNHFVELIVPFGLFGPQRLRRWAGVITIIFQITIISSGNLSWLNWLTLIMCIPCFDDEFLLKFKKLSFLNKFNLSLPKAPLSTLRTVFFSLLTCALIFLSIDPALNLISSAQAMNTSYSSWHLVNSYGAFGSIERTRFEVIIKATQDDKINADTKWVEYEFKCKPGDVTRRPCLITPYHYHLDWQMWFSAMSPELQDEWLFAFTIKLLQKNKLVEGLLASVPFGDSPPRFIKMDLYQYHFARWEKWPQFWWERRFVKEYMPPISLDSPFVRKYLKINAE